MWLLFLACSSPDPAPAEAPAPVEEPAAPAGTIDGEPILEQPVVIGGIANAAVSAVIEQGLDTLRACHSAPGAGKLLLHFVIAQDGQVRSPTLRSTTLRHPATEACVLEAVAALRFPALTRGERAVVTWPLALP
jgi:hypothetical protein